MFFCVFQNGFVSALPYILSYIGTVGSGQVADWLRFNKILTTGEVRKVFGTAGEFNMAVNSSPGRYLGQVLLGMCRWHLRTPTPL